MERGQQKGSRVSALDRTRSGLNGGQWAAEGKGELLFENVSFCYPSRPQHVALDSVSLRVPGGLTVAVVGSSGCGKSTLFALALRFYAPRSGRITLDGVDLQDVPEATLRRAVAWVPQEPPIFANRTVMENMAYGRSMVAGSAGPGLAELEPAARAARARSRAREARPRACLRSFDGAAARRRRWLGARQRRCVLGALARGASASFVEEVNTVHRGSVAS